MSDSLIVLKHLLVRFLDLNCQVFSDLPQEGSKSSMSGRATRKQGLALYSGLWSVMQQGVRLGKISCCENKLGFGGQLGAGPLLSVISMVKLN